MPWGYFAAGLVGLSIAASAAHADLRISGDPTSNVTCANGVCSATAAKAVLNASDLTNMLASGDVTVQSGSIAQDITINAPLSWTSTSCLTLDSYRSISFEKPLIVAGHGALSIATNDGGANGDYHFSGKGRVEFVNLTSSLVINGTSYGLYKTLKDIIHAAHRQAHFYALARRYNAQQNGVFLRSPIALNVGTLEGLGNTISNLTIDDSTHGDEVGLISVNAGVVRDLGLINVSVTGNGTSGVGTLVAQNNGTIINCYATGSASSTDTNVGGLLDGNLNIVSGSHAAVSVTGGDGSDAGGLAAFNGRLIQQSFATGAVSVGGSSSIGGLVGISEDGFIYDSYATGAVAGGNNANVGGLLGVNRENAGGEAVVQSAYSLGPVSGGTGATAGGLIGSDSSFNQISNAYWDLDTSGVSDPHQGAGNIPDDPGITGLTDAQLKSGLPAGFDKHIWKQNPNINNGYPYLADNPPQ